MTPFSRLGFKHVLTLSPGEEILGIAESGDHVVMATSNGRLFRRYEDKAEQVFVGYSSPGLNEVH